MASISRCWPAKSMRSWACKSTLVRILGGAVRPDERRVTIGGRECRWTSPHDAIINGVTTIPRELQLVPALSIAENLALGDPPLRRVLGIPALIDRARMREDARAQLAAFDFAPDPDLPVKMPNRARMAFRCAPDKILHAVDLFQLVFVGGDGRDIAAEFAGARRDQDAFDALGRRQDHDRRVPAAGRQSVLHRHAQGHPRRSFAILPRAAAACCLDQSRAG